MPSVGRLFAVAAIVVLVLGRSLANIEHGYYSITFKNRSYGFGSDYWAFSIGAIFALFAAVYYWFPILLSRSLSIRVSLVHFWLSAFAAFGFLLLAPALFASRGLASASQRAVVAGLGVAIVSMMLFSVAQFIFVATVFWSALHTKKI